MDTKILNKYADVIVKTGINVQKGQELSISVSTDAVDFARALTESAYRRGAKRVLINWSDEGFTKLKYTHEEESVMCDIPDFSKARYSYLVDKKVSSISVVSGDPDLLKNISPGKIAAVSRAGASVSKNFLDAAGANRIRWCVAAYPDAAWAKKLFPKDPPDKAVAKLWKLIEKAMRLDKPDPAAEWAKHDAECKRLCEILNKSKFKSFTYKNSAGTDFTVGMPEDYVFTGGSEVAEDNVRFMPNLPTQEIFSAPHKDTAEGTLVSAMPLVSGGNVIEDFSLTFKAGEVVDFSAKKGRDILKGILDMDGGARRLGEIAFVGYDTPIQNLKTLFYETLFDENASCHFALGSSYPNCIKGGEKMSAEERAARGLNDSIEHTDFMVGTSDLSIIGTAKNGDKTVIFKDGNFAV